MNIQYAKELLTEYFGQNAPNTAEKAKELISRYYQNYILPGLVVEMANIEESSEVTSILLALNCLACAEMGTQHGNDPKRQARKKAERRRKKYHR